MKYRVLLALDSFKGSLTSLEAGRAAAKGFDEKYFETRVLPLADGGEGTLEMLGYFFKLELYSKKIRDLYGKEIPSKIYYNEKFAFLEAAHTAGLREHKDVFKASSQGFGQEILLAAGLGPEKIILGLGGTGVNDGGMGLLQALGLSFFKDDRLLEPSLESLLLVNRVEGKLKELPPIIVASDVNNPLLGELGASRIYGPQKGLEEEDIPRVDKAMENYARLLENHLGKRVKDLPGAGAAGGLGFALLLLGAELRPGFDLLTELCDFESQLDWAQLVITGEGSFDSQSLQGKGPVELARMAKKKKIAAFGLFGSVFATSPLFDGIFSILQAPVSLEEAMDRDKAAKNLEKTARALAGALSWQRK